MATKLTALQAGVLKRFYSFKETKISLDKAHRDSIWDDFKNRREIKNERELRENHPALYAEIARALDKGKNIQPAVFSECIYSQELARIFNLIEFKDYLDVGRQKIDIPEMNNAFLDSLTIRYSYKNPVNADLLLQAGGANGVDCAFYSHIEKALAMIELKEPYARTSDGNLPKYGEDGYIVSSEKFEKKYPQLVPMLEEHIEKNLNVFEHLGNNVNMFSKENIEKAVSENYSGKKFADFICTEDSEGFLVMLPSSDVSRWATLEGEIRPSGRNHYKVWTPLRLRKVLEDKGAIIRGSKVEIGMSNLKSSNARGGSQISRYKIDPAFFVYKRNIEVKGENGFFDFDSVRQLIPSITAKMNFQGLEISKVKKYYLELV
jgi:hypothetical protein